MFRTLLTTAAAALLTACGGPDAPELEQCTHPLVCCEGDPALCPVPEPRCRILVAARGQR